MVQGAAAAAAAAKRPAPQSRQRRAPSALLRPAAQLLHAVLSAAENRPAAHAAHATAPPMAAAVPACCGCGGCTLCCPAKQERQSGAFACVVYRPAAHGAQLAGASTYVPGGQAGVGAGVGTGVGASVDVVMRLAHVKFALKL